MKGNDGTCPYANYTRHCPDQRRCDGCAVYHDYQERARKAIERIKRGARRG